MQIMSKIIFIFRLKFVVVMIVFSEKNVVIWFTRSISYVNFVFMTKEKETIPVALSIFSLFIINYPFHGYHFAFPDGMEAQNPRD